MGSEMCIRDRSEVGAVDADLDHEDRLVPGDGPHMPVHASLLSGGAGVLVDDVRARPNATNASPKEMNAILIEVQTSEGTFGRT